MVERNLPAERMFPAASMEAVETVSVTTSWEEMDWEGDPPVTEETMKEPVEAPRSGRVMV